jgi:AraC-like DNA-binding protein
LLLENKINVREVASFAGYTNSSQFADASKRKFGIVSKLSDGSVSILSSKFVLSR